MGFEVPIWCRGGIGHAYNSLQMGFEVRVDTFRVARVRVRVMIRIRVRVRVRVRTHLLKWPFRARVDTSVQNFRMPSD